MNYLVMETHPAYVVVLDDGGRFLKAANQNYQVGQRLSRIIPFQQPRPSISFSKKAGVSLAGLAACLCLVFGGYFGYYQPNFTPYGAMLVEINPQVELTLSQTQRVLSLEGKNADGQTLLEGYDYHNKTRDTVVEELVERAMDLGFLSSGESVTLTVQGEDGDWSRRQEEETLLALQSRYGDLIVIEIGGPSSPSQEIILTLPPDSQTQSSAPASPPQEEEDDDDDGHEDHENDDDDREDSTPPPEDQPAAVSPPSSQPSSQPSSPPTQTGSRGDDDDEDDDEDDDDGDDDDDNDGENDDDENDDDGDEDDDDDDGDD